MVGRTTTALDMLPPRVKAIGEAYRNGCEEALREELRQLSSEALLLSTRLDPIIPDRTCQRQRIAVER
jgi:hypothetical protein